MAKKTAKKTTGRKTAKKTTARKTTRKAPAKKAPAKKTTGTKPARIVAAVKPRTKNEIMTILAENAGITKKEVASVFETMSTMIAADLKRGKAGQFTVPGMMKVTVQRKPATKARKGINPFTKEPTIFKAKPARNVVKVRPMKGLKDLVS